MGGSVRGQSVDVTKRPNLFDGKLRRPQMMRRKVDGKVVKTAKVMKKVERKRKYEEMIDVQEVQVPDVKSLSLKKKAMEIKTTDSAGAPRKKRKVIKKDKN